jgi:L-threonylcarbamoyladenylate synthase
MRILEVQKIGEESAIRAAIDVLSQGGLVVYPTETTYGIGADCENEQAIQKLLIYKSKRDGKPLSVAVANQQMAEKYVHLNATAQQVYKTFLPGPVTVVSTGKHVVAPRVESVTGTLGIRIPKYDLALNMVREFGKGITATGANASYKKRPYTTDDIFTSISQKQKDLIDLVLDVGELPHNEPSTVIDTTLDDITVMRRGDVKFGKEETFTSNSEEETKQIAARLLGSYRSKLAYEPLLFALRGEMGVGKTHFVKGLAEGLRLEDLITSPTYSLSNEYEFMNEERPSIFAHVDTWRMESEDEFDALQLERVIQRNGVLAIEWADKVADRIDTLRTQAQVIWVDIEPVGEYQRAIHISHPSKEGNV